MSVIEQCFSDTSRYPSAIEPTSGVITGCSAQADLSAGSTIAFFPSGGAYILSVTNARDGETGHLLLLERTRWRRDDDPGAAGGVPLVLLNTRTSRAPTSVRRT